MSRRLLAGMDLHLKSNYVCLMTSDGEVVVPYQRFANNWPGLQALIELLVQVLSSDSFDGLDLGGEASGLLWFHPFYHLAQAEALLLHGLLRPA